MKMGTGRENMMNRAAAEEPKGGAKAGTPRPPAAGAAAKKSDQVGNERTADMAGAIKGQPTDGNPLRGAVQHLNKMHSIAHDDLGPHHGPKHMYKVR